MGGSHGIGHQLGPLGVGHGETTCVMLPWVLKYNYIHGNPAVRSRQEKVLAVLWSESIVAEMLKERGLKEGTATAGDVIGAIVSELGMPRTLKDVNVTKDKLDGLAENSLKDRCLPTNPIPLEDKESVLEILNMALG
jgi:alcohol dehydrogenase class IV